MGAQIEVVIADGHRLFREGIRMILHPEKGTHVVSEATNGLQTIDVVSDLKPDVVLLGIITPEIDGIQIIQPLREKSPKTKVLMFTSSMDEAAILKALKVGAKGYRLFRQSTKGSCG